MKRMSTRAILFLSGLLFFVIISYTACKRQHNSEHQNLSDLSQDARDWFRSTVVAKEKEMIAQPYSVLPSTDYKRKLARMRGLNNLIDWKGAKEYNYKGLHYLIAPVKESIKPFDNKNFEAVRSVVFYRKNEQMKMEIIELISNKGVSFGSNNLQNAINIAFVNNFFEVSKSVDNINASFIFYDENYNHEGSFQVNNGIWKQTDVKLINDRGSAQSARPVSTILGRTTCTQCTTWYLVGIWYDTSTGEILGWEILNSWDDPSCTGVVPNGYGSNPDPNSDQQEEVDCNTQVENIVSNGEGLTNDHGTIELCAENGNTRKKCYTWTVYTQSGGLFPTYLKSKDEALQAFEDGYWRFKSLTHKDIIIDGPTVGYTISAESVSAQSSILPENNVAAQIGKMYLDFTVKVCIVCKWEVCCGYSKPQIAKNQWHVNE